MNGASTLLVIAGGAAGAAVRYVVDDIVVRRLPHALPWGTTTVNLLGSLLLGVLVGTTGGSGTAYALLAVGFCGALTTWSTLALQTAQLLRPRLVVAGAYVALNLVGGIALAYAGLAVTGGLSA